MLRKCRNWGWGTAVTQASNHHRSLHHPCSDKWQIKCQIEIKNVNHEGISGMLSPGWVPLLAPSLSHHSGTVLIQIRQFGIDSSSTRPDGARSHSEAGREKKQEGEGRLVVGVSPCRFPQSQQIFSLTRSFNYSRVFISWRWSDSEWSLAGAGKDRRQLGPERSAAAI